LNSARTITFSRISDNVALVDRVVEYLQEMIMNGSLATDDKLPPERELAGQLGVSRTVIRESLRILRAKGLIDSVRGIGTSIKNLENHNFSTQLTFFLRAKKYEVSLEQYHQVRTILEGKIAELATQNVNEKCLRFLEGTIVELRNMDEQQEFFPEIDTRFHRCLAEMAKNPLLLILLDTIRDLLADVREKVKADPKTREISIQDHTQIVACLRARDPDGTRRAMEAHLTHVLKALKKAIKVRKVD
jgi:GntR family transcriptional regulator, transcriptional repressor for pyruvate dehydrogenase complex